MPRELPVLKENFPVGDECACSLPGKMLFSPPKDLQQQLECYFAFSYASDESFLFGRQAEKKESKALPKLRVVER